jgi:hypothetical protein
VAVANETDRVVKEELKQKSSRPPFREIGTAEIRISEYQWMVWHIERAMNMYEAAHATSEGQCGPCVPRYLSSEMMHAYRGCEMPIEIRGDDSDAIW